MSIVSRFTVLAIVAALFIFCPPAQADERNMDNLDQQLISSVALLYAQTDDGGMRNFCTCTPFERDRRDPNVYRFVTAAHCISEDNVDTQKAEPAPINWYITFDEAGASKRFYRAKVVAVGYMNGGDDLAVLEARVPNREITVFELAKESPRSRQMVVNVGGPLGLGKQFLYGYVTLGYLDRPIVGDGINWQGSFLLDIQSGPGSSGSSIIDRESRQIVGILVGGISVRATKYTVAIPIGRFQRFYQAVKQGKYPHFNAKAYRSSFAPKAGSSANSVLNRLQHRILELNSVDLGNRHWRPLPVSTPVQP